MTLSYGPGPALLVAVPGLALLTPDDDLARRAWVVLDAGGGPEELVVELIRNGLATLGPFVLVDSVGDRARVLVRGTLTAQVDSAGSVVRWSGAGVTTWAERVFEQVVSARAGDADPDGTRWPLRAGVVRCAGFELRPALTAPDGPSTARASTAGRPAEVVAAIRTRTTWAPDEPATTDEAVPPGEPGERGEPDRSTGSEGSGDPGGPEPRAIAPDPSEPSQSEIDSRVEPLVDALPPVPIDPAPDGAAAGTARSAPPPPPVPSALTPPPKPTDPGRTRTDELDDGFDHLFESTIMRSVEDAAIREVTDETADEGALPADPVVEASADRLGDHDGHTITAADLADLRSPEPAPVAAPIHGPARLELSTGDVIVLDRDVVIGRRPQVDRVQGGQVPTVVTVPSPQQDVSRTHLRIGWNGALVTVTDLHSMNGTALIGTDGAARALAGGVPHPLAEGDTLDIGDGVTITLRLGAADGPTVGSPGRTP